AHGVWSARGFSRSRQLRLAWIPAASLDPGSCRRGGAVARWGHSHRAIKIESLGASGATSDRTGARPSVRGSLTARLDTVRALQAVLRDREESREKRRRSG